MTGLESARALGGEPARGSEDLDGHLGGRQELIRQALATVRSLARELRPVVMDEPSGLGLAGFLSRRRRTA